MENKSSLTLKSLVFCLSNAPDDLFGSLSQRLPIMKPPESGVLATGLLDSRINPAQTPTCFATPPGQNLLPWHSYPGTEELEATLQYEFEDGTCLTSREVFYHPFSRDLPLELLPLLGNISKELQENTWIHLLREPPFPTWGNLRQAELAMLAVLMKASDFNIPVWITLSKTTDRPREGFQLYKIDFLKNLSNSPWKVCPLSNTDDPSDQNQLGLAELQFQRVPEFSNGLIFRHLEINFEKRILQFHPLERIFEIGTQAIFSIEPQAVDNKTTFLLKGHSHIKKCVARMDDALSKNKFPIVYQPLVKTVIPAEIDIQLWLDETGKFRFCRKFLVNDHKIEVWNLPTSTALLLDCLTSGLGGMSETAAKYLAQDRKGTKRDRDLKVLKNNGLFAAFLLELCSYVLNRQTSDGKPLGNISEFLNSIYQKLGALLIELERKLGFVDLGPPLPLDKLCSKNVVDLIETFTKNLLAEAQSSTESVFTEIGEIRLSGGFRNTLQIFHTFLSFIAQSSRGQCFLKPRLNIFSTFIDQSSELSSREVQVLLDPKIDDPSLATVHNYLILNPWVTPDQILSMVLPLKRQHCFSIYYQGKFLDEMNPTDFESEFLLTEPGSEEKSSSGIDWFELHPQFFFKGIEIDPNQLQRLSKEGVLEFQGKIYLVKSGNLPSIQRLEMFWSKIQKDKLSLPKRSGKKLYYHLPRNQILEMLALRASGVKVEGGENWKKICRFYDSLGEKRQPLDLPSSIHAELKPYQKIGVQWLVDLYSLNLGGILADDMGLGKTIQTLSFLEYLRNTQQMGRVLIVVPTSLTFNWLSECARFTPDIPIRIFQTKLKDGIQTFLDENQHSVLICTYGLFTEYQEYFSNTKWNILVLDEAQNLKNISAKRTTASRSITAKFKLCLTGTPFENHLGEFYSLLDLVVSGSLGDLDKFREKFVKPEVLNPGDVKYLKLKAKPLILRRTKSEILSELPPKIESSIKLPFESKQEKIYRDIALSWNSQIREAILQNGESKSQLLMLTALLRLRQACSDPGAIPNIKYDEEPPKLTVLMEAVQEVTEAGESALVFTQFLPTFERIKKELIRNKIEHYSLHGGTSRVDREKTLSRFKASERGSVLLMTLKTGGVGLNLTKASYVFHIEPWWNPAVENQASDRAHRIGQLKPVQVYRYLMKESVEEKIQLLKEKKAARFNALFSPTEDEGEIQIQNSHLTQDDFEFLLGRK